MEIEFRSKKLNLGTLKIMLNEEEIAWRKPFFLIPEEKCNRDSGRIANEDTSDREDRDMIRGKNKCIAV